MYTFRSLIGGEVYDLPSAASVSMGFELSDISGATIKYALNGINADKVVEDATIIAYKDGTEIKGGRWWLQGTTGEEAVDDVIFKTIAGKNLFCIFEKVVVHTGASDGKLAFTAKTPGAILITLFTAAQARGAMTGITWDFTATLDSEGQAWPDAYDISYSITDTYLKIIQGMFDNAWAEFGFNGTVFQATRPFQYGSDLSATVELIAGKDFFELPYKTSIEDRIHYALVAGDEGSQANYYAAGATGPYGREEAGATQGGVQGATLSVFAFNMVRDNNKNARENTRKVVVGGTTPIPGVAFNVGDTITERINATVTTSRVKAMALGVDQFGQASASIVVGDRILDSDIAAARARNALSGSVRSTGGTGTVTPPTSGTVADTNTPSAPTALAGFTDGYLDTNGYFRAYVSLTWTPPTTNTDASTLNDLSGYEVQWRNNSGSLNWSTTRVNDATHVVAGLEPGMSYQFRVRALDNASPPHLSAFTSILSQTTATDNIAPPTPKAPTSITTRGTAVISWNGKSSTDASMGIDFNRVDVHRSLVNNFTPDTTTAFATRVGQMSGPGSIIFDDQAYNTTYYYKLVAYDNIGNMSAAASAQVAATTAPLVTGDLADLSITLGKLAANSVDVDKLVAGSVTGVKLSGDAIDGKVITGATLRTAAAGKRVEIKGATDTTPNVMEFWSGDGSSALRMYGITSGLGYLEGIQIQGPRKPIFSSSAFNQMIRFTSDGTMYIGSVYGTPTDLDQGGWSNEMTLMTFGVSGTSPNEQSYFVMESPTYYYEYFTRDAGGGAWTVGSLGLGVGGLAAPDMRMVEFSFTDSTLGTTTSTTGISMGARGGQGTFYGPASGIMKVTVAGLLSNATAGQSCYLGYTVKTGLTIGSGSSHKTYNVTDAVVAQNPNQHRGSVLTYVTGLTPGAPYNIQQLAWASGGTAQYNRGRLYLEPSL